MALNIEAVSEAAMQSFDRWRVQRARDRRILEALEVDARHRTAEQAALVAVGRLIGSGFCV